MMILDAHQHFWHYRPAEFSWIDDGMTVLKRDFLPEDLLPELKDMQVQGTIAVQARQSREETLWLLKLAEENECIKGVIGWTDLCSNRVEEHLVELAHYPKLTGVRHVVHDEPNINFMLRDDFRRGIGLLSTYGLTYDLLLFPEHLSPATKLASEFPDQLFVLDHLAKPRIKDQSIEPWATDLAGLSEYPNVYCKLSGMVTQANWQQWKAKDFSSYLDCVFNYFSPDRLMIGSDWPVCLLAASYRETLSVVTNYIAGLDPEDQAKILGENCQKVYLNPANPTS